MAHPPRVAEAMAQGCGGGDGRNRAGAAGVGLHFRHDRPLRPADACAHLWHHLHTDRSIYMKTPCPCPHLFLAGPAGRGILHGTYQIGSCGGTAPPDGRMSIAGEQIQFWESACRLTNPVPVRDMLAATLYDMACSGEGETWMSRILLMPGFDSDLILAARGGWWSNINAAIDRARLRDTPRAMTAGVGLMTAVRRYSRRNSRRARRDGGRGHAAARLEPVAGGGGTAARPGPWRHGDERPRWSWPSPPG